MASLRFLAVVVLLFGSVSNRADAQTNSSQSALIIAVKPVTSTFVVGRPALIKVSLTNRSQKTVTLDVLAPHAAYHLFDFSLTAHNQPVKETSLHRSIKNRQRVGDPPANLSVQTILVDILPGSTKTYEADLTHLFSLEEATSYHLVVSMADPTSGVRIVSPELLINIIN